MRLYVVEHFSYNLQNQKICIKVGKHSENPELVRQM